MTVEVSGLRVMLSDKGGADVSFYGPEAHIWFNGNVHCAEEGSSKLARVVVNNADLRALAALCTAAADEMESRLPRRPEPGISFHERDGKMQMKEEVM